MSQANHYRTLVPLWVEWLSLSPRIMWKVAGWPAALLLVTIGLVRHGHVQTLKTISLACNATWMESLCRLVSAEFESIWYRLDFAVLHRIDEKCLRTWANIHTTLDDSEGVLQDLSGRPAIFLLASFALHYVVGLSLPGSVLRSNSLVIVQPSMALTPLTAIGFYEKLSRGIGQEISTVPADNMAVMARVGRHLNNNGWVAMRVDSIPVHTNGIVISQLLGRDSAFPANIITLAQRTGATLVPIFVIREGPSYRTSFGRPIDVASDTNDADLQDLAIRIDAEISEAILSHPEKYSAWPAVTEKWRMADEILAIIYKE